MNEYMKTLNKKPWDNYYIKLGIYAITTLSLGSIGIYALTQYMEEYTITSKIGQGLETGQIPTQKEMIKFIQYFPIQAKEVILEAMKDGMTEDEVREVYAYYKEYNGIGEK